MKIDQPGTYLGKITEATLGLTKKSSYPQLIARFVAAQKFVGDIDGMKHFGITEPAYCPWPEEEIVGYLCLFNDTEKFDATTALLSYEQVKVATGWDGTSFDALTDGSLIGKEVLFRVEEGTPEFPNLKVSWIDAKDAAPERTLKAIDAATLKTLNAGLKFAKAAKPVAAAKATPAARPTPTTGRPSAPAPAASAGSPAATPAAKTPPSKGPPTTAKAPPLPATETLGLPKEQTQTEAWDLVFASNAGANEDSVVEDSWLAACAEVGDGKEEKDFTGGMWARVCDTVLKDLDLKPKLR